MRPSLYLRQRFLIDARLVIEAFQLRQAGQLQQIFITHIRLREEQQMIRTLVFVGVFVEARAAGEVALHADDGLDARLLGGIEEIDHAKHHAVIGNRHRGLLQFLGPLDNGIDFAETIEH